MKSEVSEEFQKCLLLDDIRGYHPDYAPYVFIARSLRKQEDIGQLQGKLEESIGVQTFMVPTEQKNLVVGKISYEDIYAGQSYFENDRKYITGETFERNGVNYEIIVNDRFFEGLDLAYFEPTDRLVIYLNLHREGNNWLNPYAKDIVIKTGDTERGWEPHDAYLSVRKSELVDYLAARKCGLLLLSYSERILETPIQLIGLPEPFNDKPTAHGRQSWIVDRAPSNRDNYMYFSRLWESFWIEPASHPRRWDAQTPEEFKDGIQFVLGNGETTTYKQDGKDRYFELLSFKPSLFKSFLSLPNNSVEFHCLSNLSIRYADGVYLTGCINREGQFQTFFSSVAKLNIEKQRQLAAFSEEQKAKLSYEYFRTHIEAKWPETLPFCWILANCLKEVNAPWQEKYGETLLLSPTKAEIPIWVQIGPTSDDYNELADIMLELQKSVIPESKFGNIKSQLDYTSFAPDAKSYENIRSIGFVRLFFRANRLDQTEGQSYILQVINKLRNCKTHPKSTEEVLRQYNIPTTSPRTAFLHIMSEFSGFLSAFKELSEGVLGVTIGMTTGKVKDPWMQIEIARRYFLKPF